MVVYDGFAKMTGRNFCRTVRYPMFRIVAVNPAKPAVDDMFQTYPCHVLPKVVVPYEKAHKNM